MTKVTEQLTALGTTEEIVQPDNIKLVLHNNYANGSDVKAKELLLFFRDAVEGLLVPITHPSKTLATSGSVMNYDQIAGADNLHGVTCYLDSLMFAMFARLENFEPILYKTFESDEKRENLAIFLRLYVNLLRSGKLITTDVTKCLLDTIFNAGWTPSSKRYEQQDAAELFNFITEKLSMPLLTLRVDIAHAGKEVAEDDHKLVNERLLLVPIPGERTDPPVTLEECLERYFANSVEVSRQLERFGSDFSDLARRSPSANHSGVRKGASSPNLAKPVRKFSLETVEIPRFLKEIERKATENQSDAGSGTGRSSPAIASTEEGNDENDYPDHMVKKLRTRASTSHSLPPSYDSLYKDRPPPTLPPQKVVDLWNQKNEITLPAWMFLQLLPFYSDMRSQQQKKHDKKVLRNQFLNGNGTANEDKKDDDDENDEVDAPVEEHFANARPVLGICLKRYSWTPEGQSIRNDRQVIVPQTIHLPSFVADDSEEGSLFGNFKLVLESAIFHRGTSINSGHFVAIAAEDAAIDYSAEEVLPSNNNSTGSFFNSRRRHHRRHHTHNDRDVLPVPKSPLSQPVSGRNSESGPRPKRWVFFDDLQPVGKKTQIVDFDEVFARECPYLLFYRMVSANDDEALSTKSRGDIQPLPYVSSLDLSHSSSIESDTLDSVTDTFVNVPPFESQTTIQTMSTVADQLSTTGDRGRGGNADTSSIDMNEFKNETKGERRSKLFRLTRGKSAQDINSRSRSAPPDKRNLSTPRMFEQGLDPSLPSLDVVPNPVYPGATHRQQPLASGVDASRMSSRSLRRRANETQYNVDEKCVLM
ncbi:hypothetical protein AWJ20_279 [Sugiyamaella lignohabitans]|uniref:ubiquitinyl hydrolase 1 n=1 Tax=Sugiyamaella lignohabitans TaxID=796027 RepID=A0A167CS87_9ASCO|nr:uncharacterized protein AWJ20_279 [Sugiyamaella lignohabitans]ANB12046.1 hypothetical protein AWJ20_279 [Sugiyamaella lignohabitans]